MHTPSYVFIKKVHTKPLELIDKTTIEGTSIKSQESVPWFTLYIEKFEDSKSG
jgi:hypothetical protein